MTKQKKLLRKNMQKTLNILVTNLENKEWKKQYTSTFVKIHRQYSRDQNY